MKLVTFTYTIVEQNQLHPEAAITYDESVHTVTVTVTKDATGQLNADVQYDGKRIPYFYQHLYTSDTSNSCSSNSETNDSSIQG